MIFAVLFVCAFLCGLVVYHFNRQWLVAVLIPVSIFSATILFDQTSTSIWFSVFFGVPIVFVGALLGTYVYQTRLVDEPEDDSTKSENLE